MIRWPDHPMTRFLSNYRRFPKQQRPVFRPFDEIPGHVIAESRLVSRPAPQSLVIARDVGCGIEIPLLQERPLLAISAQHLAAVKSMRREIVDASHWRAAFDAVQFRRARLPIEYSFHVWPCAPLHFGGHVCRLCQAEGLMPVGAAQDAGIQHPTHCIESVPAPGPRASSCSRSITEWESLGRLDFSVRLRDGVAVTMCPPRLP